MAYQLREATLPVLPPGAASIRVLHFSDLHLTPDRMQEIADIKSFINLKPDLVISTGDFLAHMDAVPVALHALDELLALPGLFVFGSNDYYAPKFKNPLNYLRRDHGPRKLGNELPSKDLAAGLERRGTVRESRLVRGRRNRHGGERREQQPLRDRNPHSFPAPPGMPDPNQVIRVVFLGFYLH